jgi:hypothetical protein
MIEVAWSFSFTWPAALVLIALFAMITLVWSWTR